MLTDIEDEAILSECPKGTLVNLDLLKHNWNDQHTERYP
jgi:hypothetical protein